jgi:hypothetical protein
METDNKKRVLTDFEKLDFAYGTLACSTNHKPSRAAFIKTAMDHLGMSHEEAELWASSKTWERK